MAPDGERLPISGPLDIYMGTFFETEEASAKSGHISLIRFSLRFVLVIVNVNDHELCAVASEGNVLYDMALLLIVEVLFGI